ncbi:reduction in Cnn dots 1 isoform X2 [Leptinotarsa decemlineata]|uniref:reduction in Cnn dots 1 isoform X2 n=1 Tax=Leptinotarsa decemlineata TaxID=7539 RepID=UPI003D30B9F1
MVVEEISKYTYPTQLTNSFDRENWTVSTDHCYARPWNWRPDASFLRPTKTLFVRKLIPEKPKTANSLMPLEADDIIDVVTNPEIPAPVYDENKAKNVMEECERYAFAARMENEEDWDEKISKINWSNGQHKVFSSMTNILNNFNLAKLALKGIHNEPLLRRNVIDKAVQRVRRLFASVTWDPKITQWLHQLLIDNLGPHYLACYLDILQTLKYKLPAFADKMMYSSSSSLRIGSLNNMNLMSLLEKYWDPLASSLMQDKPKKLPGNPVLVIVPTGPVITKMIHKWIKLLSHLATVVTIPTNFGLSSHRMAMPSILDQLFSVTRGKIQDVREDYPGRHIILVGFGSGASLALQVAQVENIMCVVSIGFSLLTAEGSRGEPDDNLLELQCPVLFVIGQCSNTSSQEDLEELRERMRVETGLIVVGSADDNLRVTKKKKNAEGITQSVIDRCIVDEVGEFISGIILSPYPPQIRQSPTHVPPDIPVKKVGRPPGSKTKNRLGLEAKWAQQMAQGNTRPSSPTPSPPPPYPKIPTPDTSSTDSSQPDKHFPKTTDPSVKKIRTLKPVVSSDKTPTTSPLKSLSTTPARMQAYGLNRSVLQGNTSNLSTLLQGGIKTIPPSQPKPSSSGIKVLENVTLNSSTTAKLIQNRTIDLSKITLINSVKGAHPSMNNVLLLPDGKLKNLPGSTVKGTGGTPILLPLSPQRGPPKPNRTKFITAKRQLMTQKPPRPVKNPLFAQPPNVQSSLPPPTNLTTEDIMDLPIIFADDNQMLDTNLPSSLASTTTSIPTSTANVLSTMGPKTVTPAKFMVINKQPTSQGSFVYTPSIRKPTPLSFNKPAQKYTKIILSSKKNVDDLKANSKIQCLSPEITVKKVLSAQGHIPRTEPPPAVELIDLENEIKATAVPKPNLSTSDIKNIKIIPKNSGERLDMAFNRSSVGVSITKRPSSVIDIADDGDPDYIPPKNLKLE